MKERWMHVCIATNNDHDKVRRLRHLEARLWAEGFCFDTGIDVVHGERDWELDWSFSGPTSRNDVIARLKKTKLQFKIDEREPEEDK